MICFCVCQLLRSIQHINPFELNASPVSPYVSYVSVSSRATLQPAVLTHSFAPQLAFHEQVVCFAVRAPFASLFVRRSKAGGLQQTRCHGGAWQGRGERESVFFFIRFFLFARPSPPPRRTRESLRTVNLIRELLGNAGDFYWEILRSLDLIVNDRRHV